MVNQYVPDTGDIVFLDFDPQVGREQAKRRPALVLTDLRYNRASGLAVVCPLTSKVKPYPFTLPITVGSVEGAVLIDQLKSIRQYPERTGSPLDGFPADLRPKRDLRIAILRGDLGHQMGQAGDLSHAVHLYNPIGSDCDLQRVAQLQVSAVRYGLRDPDCQAVSPFQHLCLH